MKYEVSVSDDKMNKNVPLMFRSIGFLLMILLLASCAQPTVPRLVQSNGQPHLPGKFVWYDLFTNDMKASAVFYRELFGWEFADSDFKRGRVKTIRLHGVPIANAVEIELPNDGANRPKWLGYISVEDVDHTVDTVKRHGGEIHLGPKDLPHRGRIAVCFDPQGAAFAVVRSSAGDPPDTPPVNHQLIGSELWTKGLDAALAFYQASVGFTEIPVIMEDGSTYRLLAADKRPRAGLAEILWEDVRPNWVPYVVVENVREIVTKAEACGGQLLLGLRDDASENSAAILSDPTGAVFGVQKQWRPREVQP